MQKKQLLQDPGYVRDIKDSCCMLHALYKNTVKDVKDIKTSHNRFQWVYLFLVEDVKDVYKLQCRFLYEVFELQ